MGWVHDVPEDDLYDHEGYVVAILADGTEPEPIQVPVSTNADLTSPNSAWWLYNGKDGKPLATGVKAGCACGWRSDDVFPVDFEDEEETEGFESNTGPFAEWQYGHIASLKGVAVPRELREALTTVAQRLREASMHQPLVALTVIGQLEELVGDLAPTAGAAARLDGQTWTTIGKALNTTRQAAFQRFKRFLDPELVANPND
ncbi:hypothetical protein ACFT8W_20880 [Streptomyces hygroscopicus]|uniref:hypothetical protein n=1 Tax=Streptomyces hygroscopicus TaxID=1912 RepID=UPI00363B7C2F